MATFPSISPSLRTFTPGEYPNTPFGTLNLNENRVRHSNVMLASQLRVSFVGITEATMLSILSHYNGQQGNYLSFGIPSELLSGVSSASEYTLSNYRWRYSEPPMVEDYPCGGHTVDVVLESVPPENAVMDGLAGSVTVSLTAGSAAAANGPSLTVTASLAAGAANVDSDGIDATVTVSLAAGTASGA